MTRQEACKEYEKNISALKDKFRVRLTENEIKEAYPDAMPGEIKFRNPHPIESKDIWHLLSNYYGALQFEVCKKEFNSTGLNISPPIIAREIAKLEKFIAEAENMDWDDDKQKSRSDYSEKWLYIKLKHGYYQNIEFKEGIYPGCLLDNSAEARVYGKYFLFYDYLKDLLRPNNYIAQAMAVKLTEAKLKEDRREIERANDYKALIDSDNYSPSIEKFGREAIITKMNFTKPEYLLWLQNNEKRYANSTLFYTKWGGSTLTLADEHRAIFEYINSEIEAGLMVEGQGHQQFVHLKTLTEAFINQDAFNEALSALKTIKAIDKGNNNLIGSKLKGVIQVWIKILRADCQKLKHIPDQDLTVLLNRQFNGLNLSEKTNGKHFRNYNKSASNLYRAKLLACIR